MPLDYSPLCDVDLSAYLAYLAASFGNGSAVVGDKHECVGEGDGEVGSSSGDASRCVSGDCGGVTFLRAAQEMAVVLGSTFVGDSSGFDRDVGYKSQQCARKAVGFPCVSVGGGVSGVGDGDCNEPVGPVGPEVLPVASVSGGVSEVPVAETVGANTLRNRQWRKERKDRKKRRQSGGLSRGVDVGRGYFSECSNDTRVSLRESRAAMLVAKNDLERKKAEDRLRLIKVEQECKFEERSLEIKRLRIESDLKNQIVGFAETVVSGSMSPPGLSPVVDSSSGTISPNSSISVAEEYRIRLENSELTERVKALELAAKERILDGEKKTRVLVEENEKLSLRLSRSERKSGVEGRSKRRSHTSPFTIFGDTEVIPASYDEVY